MRATLTYPSGKAYSTDLNSLSMDVEPPAPYETHLNLVVPHQPCVDGEAAATGQLDVKISRREAIRLGIRLLEVATTKSEEE